MTPKQTSQLAMQIAAANLPVLFVDTCSVIDIARGQARISMKDLSDAHSIINSSPAKCTLVGSSLLPLEYADNIEQGVSDFRKAYNNGIDTAKKLEQTSLLLARPATALGLDPLLIDDMKALADKALAMIEIVEHDPKFVNLAHHRVLRKLRPSKLGTIKDPQILEECLDIGKLLVHGSFAQPVVFLTSNTGDFCAPNSLAPHPDFGPDLATAKILFATTWERARILLGV